MDKSIFISMGGAQNAMQDLQVVTNNLANINTTGFRGDLTASASYQVSEKGAQSRVYGKMGSTYTDFTKGNILNTESDLDVALAGDGFIAVQSKSGEEGYTRAGSFRLQDGVLMTKSGELVMGTGGTISIPPAEKIHISKDGTVSARFLGASEYTNIDHIKLVNPDTNELKKAADGLLMSKSGIPFQADPDVKLITGALEGSNVSAIQTMTQLIDLSRHYEIHTNFMKSIADNQSAANQLLNITR